MDTIEARLECIKIASGLRKEDRELKTILEAATEWAAFVIGPPVKESAGTFKKGADDHRAEKK